MLKCNNCNGEIEGDWEYIDEDTKVCQDCIDCYVDIFQAVEDWQKWEKRCDE